MLSWLDTEAGPSNAKKMLEDWGFKHAVVEPPKYLKRFRKDHGQLGEYERPMFCLRFPDGTKRQTEGHFREEMI